MPPKTKPAAAKGKVAPKAAPVDTSFKTEAAGQPPSLAAAACGGAASALSVEEALARLEAVPEEDWGTLRHDPDAPSTVSASKTLEAVLQLLGDPQAPSWEAAAAALADPARLVRELRALGPWGFSETQLVAAEMALKAATAAASKATAQVPKAGGKAMVAAPKAKSGPASKAGAPAKAKAPSPEPGPPTPVSASATATKESIGVALAMRQVVEAFLVSRMGLKPLPFPMVWPVAPFAQLHNRLQQAWHSRQTVCVLAETSAGVDFVTAYLERGGAEICDTRRLQVGVQLSKDLSVVEAQKALSDQLRTAMKAGRKCILLVGHSPSDLRRICCDDVSVKVFEFEKVDEVAKEFGLSKGAGEFQLVIVAKLSKSRAEKLLPKVLPSFEDMAVVILDKASLPPPAAIGGSGAKAVRNLREAVRLLAIPPDVVGEGSAEPEVDAEDGLGEGLPLVNDDDFEYIEAFDPTWDQRWLKGPADTDERGKQLRDGLIHMTLQKYPANPKDAKSCLQLVGGSPNAPCTGIWISFEPLIRPTEVEFEFTINGKVDLPNACVVFTELPFAGALQDCKVGIQFVVRGGMQLSGGSGNLVRISNDGKISHEKWNKVLLEIDWTSRVVVGQVDTKGKGYAPAIQTVPFPNKTCRGFGACYIYNTDMQGTSWFHSIRIKQAAPKEMDLAGLEARAQLAARLKQREYELAVQADMEVGMKMGAIKSTKAHNMNLAQEQMANSGSAAAQMR